MQTRDRNVFVTVTTEGALLPTALLRRIVDGDKSLEGLTPEAYHLVGEKLNEAVSRSWNRLRAVWGTFKAAADKLPESDAGTTLTREKWLLPLFQEFGYGRLSTAKPVEIGGKRYDISHGWQDVPIHLVSFRYELDKRTPGAAGASRASPHAQLQELLNRSPERLWGFASNGRQFRILRDNVALTRQAYVEFDLESMMLGEVYSDFALLWLLCHESRVEAETLEDYWLERWSKTATVQGTRALDALRDGVQHAIEALGCGFLAEGRNAALKKKLDAGELKKEDFYRQILRLVYRHLFLFVAEDRLDERGRPLLLYPKASPETVKRYLTHYSTVRLRRLSGSIRGTPHGDLWKTTLLVMERLGRDEGGPELGLPALGSFLWSKDAAKDLLSCELSNRDYLAAVRALAFTEVNKVRTSVDYKNLGSEELGGIYESLLELHPDVNSSAGTFELRSASGNDRKTTGSYYTPPSLVQCLLDSALDPDIEVAATKSNPEEAILSLKVCDPACGSGHFLIAAAHRIAKRLATIRSGEGEPSPKDTRHALRDVIGHCIFGVDLNEMAVELCKVSLWLEALEPGLPLSFLDSHIQCGNALFGAEVALMEEGPPDVAWTALKGEDKKRATSLRNANKNWRQTTLFDAADAPSRYVEVRQLAVQVESFDGDSIEAVHKKEALWRELTTGDAGRHATLIADLWCASFVWPKYDRQVEAAAPVRSLWESVKKNARSIRTDTAELLVELKKRFRFFHWYLAFPTVMEGGGFDVVLGNPPWDTLSPDRREYFGQHHPGIRSLSPEEQESIIDELMADPAVASSWERHQLDLLGLVHFLKNSGRYTLYAPGNLGKGDFNVYRMFAELALKYTRSGGYAAQVLPGGLYGGANASAIRQFMFDQCELAHLWGLSNTQRGWFGKVDIDRFSAYATRRGGRTKTFLAHFGLMSPADLAGEPIEFDADFIRTSNPETYTVPDIRSVADLTVAQKMIEAYPAFGDDTAGPPRRHYQRELDMGNDRDWFTTNPAGLPVFEGRMITHFDHRAKTYADGHGNSSRWIERTHDDPEKAIVPQWRVLPENVPDKLGNRCDRFRLAFGDVANPRNERSFTAALVPPGVICGHTVPTIVFSEDQEWMYLPWLAVGNSFLMDWFARKKLSSPHLTFSVMDSLPFPRPELDDAWVQAAAPLVLRLICTAPEMTRFWNRMAELNLCQPADEGTIPAAALLVEVERDLARAQLDAIVAHDVYRLTRTELSDVLETFPVVKKRDIKAHGEYRTKRLILDDYDAMADAMRAGKPYQTRLAPPPADARATFPAVGRVLPFSRAYPKPEERFVTAIPRYSLRTAAGAFSDAQAPDIEDWITPSTAKPLRKGMFVGQVIGRSMEPLVQDGSWCLFQRLDTRDPEGKIVLIERRGVQDPELQGEYTLKRWITESAGRVRLVAENGAYAPIRLEGEALGLAKPLAEFVEVLTAVMATDQTAAPMQTSRPADPAGLPDAAWKQPDVLTQDHFEQAAMSILSAWGGPASEHEIETAIKMLLIPRHCAAFLPSEVAVVWERLAVGPAHVSLDGDFVHRVVVRLAEEEALVVRRTDDRLSGTARLKEQPIDDWIVRRTGYAIAAAKQRLTGEVPGELRAFRRSDDGAVDDSKPQGHASGSKP